MSLNLSLRHLNRGHAPYARLASETCLTRRRAAALYLYAATRPAYLFCFAASIISAVLALAYAARAPQATLSLPPSQQAAPLTGEARTLRGYPRRYVSHVIRPGDTYFNLSQYYYAGIMDLFSRHRGAHQELWTIIRAENPRPQQQSPFAPNEIPVTIELKIPLP